MAKKTLKAFLASRLNSQELRLLYRSFDVVGGIAVIRVPESLRKRNKIIAEAVMQANKHVKTVLLQASPVFDEFRLRKLKWIAGERRTETIHKEHDCVFKVDLAKCYFSPRLSYERMRIARQVQPGEVIVNMFAGVGCFSIVIAKHSQASKIYSIDLNPDAVHFMFENVLLNRVHSRVAVIQGDAKAVIKESLRNCADRVLMPLPEKAYEYLDYALLALKPAGGRIHYYAFEHARKPEDSMEKVEAKVTEKLRRFNVDFDFSFQRIVRRTGPNWFQIVLDIKVKHIAWNALP